MVDWKTEDFYLNKYIKIEDKNAELCKSFEDMNDN